MVIDRQNRISKKWALIFKALPTDHKSMFMGKKAELTCEGWKGCCKAKKPRGVPLTSVTSAQSRMIQYPHVVLEKKVSPPREKTRRKKIREKKQDLGAKLEKGQKSAS